MEVALLVLWTVTGVIMLVLASAAFGGAGLGWGLLTLLVLHLLFFFPRVLFTFLLAPPLLALNVLCWPLRLFGYPLANPLFLFNRRRNSFKNSNYINSNFIYKNNSFSDERYNMISYAYDTENHWHNILPEFFNSPSNIWHNTSVNPDNIFYKE